MNTHSKIAIFFTLVFFISVPCVVSYRIGVNEYKNKYDEQKIELDNALRIHGQVIEKFLSMVYKEPSRIKRSKK